MAVFVVEYKLIFNSNILRYTLRIAVHSNVVHPNLALLRNGPNMTLPSSPKQDLDLDRNFVRPWQDVTKLGEEEWTSLGGSDGIYVTDTDDNELIDGPGGMWCVNVGHGREQIIEAVSTQMRALSYFSPWSMAAPITTELAERLAAPDSGRSE